jgi:dihydrolipoamide dehydrogenase
MDTKYDVIVIGAGPGGYPCGIRLGQLNKKVLVIEAKYLGGLCLNQGCIPTKALSYAGEMTDNFKKAKRMGFNIEFHGFDINIMRNWKEGIVKRLRTGIEFLFKSNNIEWKQGFAKVISEYRVQVEKNGDKQIFETEYIVIATGTDVVSLPGLDFDGKFIINTDHALELKDVPRDLLVIGAGASGLEMATIYARLGSKVTVVEMMEQILPGMETELCESLCKILKKSGISIYLNSQVIGYEIKNNRLETIIKRPEGESKEIFDKILVTVGRGPQGEAFKDIGIKTDKKGFIIVDNNLRTNIKNIFAIGDIIGAPLLAHKATKQGIEVAEIICGYKQNVQIKTIPSCVFTIPPLSSVGLTEKLALDKGYKVKVGRFPYRASGKALAMGESQGLVKIVGDENGKLLGLHILGAESSSLIAEGIIAIDKGLLVSDLTESIHPHPSLTEIIHEAAENFYKKAIHVVNK